MATNGVSAPDPLILLRDCIKKNINPIPTTTTEPSSASDAAPLETATHLFFEVDQPGGASRYAIELSTPTRFISQRNDAPLDLLSVYFSWINKDTGLTDYISAVQALQAERAKNGLQGVTNVVFTERVDLASWLSGENDESEFIKSLDDTPSARKAADGAADVARGAEDVAMEDTAAQHTIGGRGEAERIKAIYKVERPVGDHNTVLRGIKPTVSAL